MREINVMIFTPDLLKSSYNLTVKNVVWKWVLEKNSIEMLARKVFLTVNAREQDKISPPEIALYGGGKKQPWEIKKRLATPFPAGVAVIGAKDFSVIRYWDRLSSRKNRLEKVKSTMKRKTSSWEILSGLLFLKWENCFRKCRHRAVLLSKVLEIVKPFRNPWVWSTWLLRAPGSLQAFNTSGTPLIVANIYFSLIFSQTFNTWFSLNATYKVKMNMPWEKNVTLSDEKKENEKKNLFGRDSSKDSQNSRLKLRSSQTGQWFPVRQAYCEVFKNNTFFRRGLSEQLDTL